MRWKHGFFVLFLLIWGLVSDTSAQLSDALAIHGFGGWAYGNTDNANRYLAGNKHGDYDTVDFSLNIGAKPYENLALNFQFGYAERRTEDEVGIDFAFAEWRLADAFKVRVGKVKAPFMLHTETYDVGTIRPFFFLPQGLYQEIAAEAYKGAGITGRVLNRNGWELMYDLYGGTLSLQPKSYLDLQQFTFNEVTPISHDMIGGRLLLRTPLKGLSFGVSSYSGDLDFTTNLIDVSDTYTTIGASVEYLSDRLWISTEYLTQRRTSKLNLDVVYIDVAYYLTDHWQVAARYELADFSIPAIEALYPESFLEHQEVVLGINYWVNPHLVFKCSYHLVEGNRFASPETLQDFLAVFQRGAFDERTRMLLVGVQFSF